MKPVLTLKDYHLLRDLLKNISPLQTGKEIRQLSEELDRAVVLKDGPLDKKIVRLNSLVEIEDVKMKKKTWLQIVMPEQANISQKKISVLAPVSIALIGFKEGDLVEWEMPAGTKSLKITKVEQQEVVS